MWRDWIRSVYRMCSTGTTGSFSSFNRVSPCVCRFEELSVNKGNTFFEITTKIRYSIMRFRSVTRYWGNNRVYYNVSFEAGEQPCYFFKSTWNRRYSFFKQKYIRIYISNIHCDRYKEIDSIFFSRIHTSMPPFVYRIVRQSYLNHKYWRLTIFHDSWISLWNCYNKWSVKNYLYVTYLRIFHARWKARWNWMKQN